MKQVGIFYKGFVDSFPLLWAMQSGDITYFDNHKDAKSFKITIHDTEYYFSKNYEFLDHCEVIYSTIVSFEQIFSEYPDKHRHILFITDAYHDRPYDFFNQFLDNGNIVIYTGYNFNYDHERFIQFPLLSIYYFYYQFGFNFLNYYRQKNEKLCLLGVYHNDLHIGGAQNTRKNYLIRTLRKMMGDDFLIFENRKGRLSSLFNMYKYYGLWYYNHLAGYNDYKITACNFIYETYDSLHTWSSNNIVLSEKTLKAILFGEEDIFFIWYGADSFYSHLRKYGFWFLNTEFYPEIEEGNNTRIGISVLRAVEYLKDLKKELKTNNAVHEHLLEKYKHNLESNLKIFYYLKDNCPIQEQFLKCLI